jgi:hypothetical protein
MAVNFASALGGFFPGMAQGLQVAKALQELNLSGSYADDVTKASGTKGGTVTTRDGQPGADTTAPAATTTASPSGQAPTTTAPAPTPLPPEPAIPLNSPTTITRAPGGDYSPVPPQDPGYSPAKAGGYTPIPKRPAVDIPDTRPPPTTPPPDDGQQTIQTAKNAVGGAIGAGLRYLPQVFQGATNPDLYPTP